jgi:thiol-disulfide isomerase/thioredoxin
VEESPAPLDSKTATNGSPPPAPPLATKAPTPPVSYDTPLLEPQELREQARATCERALASGRPILLEFSAEWCKDCLLLASLKKAPPLEGELAEWETLPINVGDGFQHSDLMQTFQVKAIAKLIAVKPRNCATQLRTWHPKATRTLSGISGDLDVMNERLTSWLGEQRRALTR